MCGIAGVAYTDGRPADRWLVTQMTRALAHRGPDGEGFHFAPGVGLGHRRLSIVDLSEAGRQPMANEDESVWVTYNGEIYNHLELRRGLVARGHRFRSQADTEVLVHLWEEHGEAMVERLDGMFAFALWDARAQTLCLARNRIGIKPLFVHERPGELRFASEPAAFLADASLPREVDAGALDELVAQGYIGAPRTLLRAVRQLEPGEIWTGARRRRYWDFAPRAEPASPAQSMNRLEATLRGAVRSHLMADVPYGALLSSGLDSTTLVGLLVEEHTLPTRTFTAEFAEGSFSEGRAAAATAAHLGASNQQVPFGAPDVELLRRVVHHAGEPMADVSMLPFYAVCGLARRHVKVALSGEGADELFAGYETYSASLAAGPASRVPSGVRQLLRRALGVAPAGDQRLPLREKLRRFVDGVDETGRDAHLVWRQYLGREGREALGTAPPARPHGAQVLDRASHLGRLDACLYTDLRYYLPSDMLVKADRMSMAHGLEVRVPYLDNQVVQLAAELPGSLKLRAGVLRKWILRAVARRVLPREILPPRRKLGFNVPLDAWLRGPLREAAGDLLAAPRVIRQGLVRPEAVTRLVDEHLARRQNHGYALYTLLTLGLWADEFLAPPQARARAEVGA